MKKIKIHDLAVQMQKIPNQQMEIPTHLTVQELLKVIESLTKNK